MTEKTPGKIDYYFLVYDKDDGHLVRYEKNQSTNTPQEMDDRIEKFNADDKQKIRYENIKDEKIIAILNLKSIRDKRGSDEIKDMIYDLRSAADRVEDYLERLI